MDELLKKLKNKEIEKITKGPLYFAIAKSFNDQKKFDEIDYCKDCDFLLPQLTAL